MTFGDFIKPTISEEGELIGFQIRPKVIAVMYKMNQLDNKLLRRAVQVVISLNRLIREGMKFDFKVERGNLEVIKFKSKKDVGT